MPEPSPSTPPLVSADWLAAHLHDPDLRLADVRWYLPTTGKSGRDEYEQGHLPGAVFLDLDTDLSAPRGTGPGRHPLPQPPDFAAAMARAGVGNDTYVVAYDDVGGGTAARLWWLLRYFGHERVSLLDGGIQQWLASGRQLSTVTPQLAPARFKATPQPGWVVDKHAVQRLSRDPAALLLDARAPERYQGLTEPVDPRPGHIPGALNAPLAGNLREGVPLMKSPSELHQRFAALGVTSGKQVVNYCGSGVNACQNILALAVAGFPGTLLYEGSWSDWSSDPSLPAATGAERG